MHRGREIRHVLLPQALGGEARGGYRKAEHLGNRRAYRTLVANPVAQRHVVGHDASLAVGRPGEIVHPRPAVDGVGIFYRVAHGIYIGGRRAQVFVNLYAAALARGYAGVDSELGERAHAYRQNHHVGVELAAVAECEHEAVAPFPEGRHGGVEPQVDALLHQMVPNDGGHRKVERRHHLIGHLHERDRHAAMAQILHHFQPNEARSYHHGAAHLAAGHKVRYGVGVGHVAQGEDARQVDTRQRRTERHRARRQQKAVVALLRHAPVGAFQRHGLALGVQGHGLGIHADIHVEPPPERRRRLHQEIVVVFDYAAYIIW